MNRFDIINRIGDKYRVGNTETGEFPVKHNADGIVFDETHEFSDDGYIPDWEWMDSYMRSLPYSDRL